MNRNRRSEVFMLALLVATGFFPNQVSSDDKHQCHDCVEPDCSNDKVTDCMGETKGYCATETKNGVITRRCVNWGEYYKCYDRYGSHGCWENNGKFNEIVKKCEAGEPSDPAPDIAGRIFTCFCEGNLCNNKNLGKGNPPPPPPVEKKEEKKSGSGSALLRFSGMGYPIVVCSVLKTAVASGFRF